MLEAWDFRMGKLSKRWHFSTDSLIYENFKGQGNHSLAVGDVDGDGKDEVTYGACLIDDDALVDIILNLGMEMRCI